jgi:hypothetical protein
MQGNQVPLILFSSCCMVAAEMAGESYCAVSCTSCWLFKLGLWCRRALICVWSFGPKNFGLSDRGLSTQLPIDNHFCLLYLIVRRGMPVNSWICFRLSTTRSKNTKIILCWAIFFSKNSSEPIYVSILARSVILGYDIFRTRSILTTILL